ncbi:MAG: hypothetical protein ABH874_00605 [Methanobacteriota archaeon]|nr:hypothetical protein [Candidatus Hydrothermarchaeota archaeon]
MAIKFNEKLVQPDGMGGHKLRIWHRKGNKRTCPRYLVKCGDCDNSIEIYYDDRFLEIGGVHASLEEWRKILLPLLKKHNSRRA